MSYHVKLHSYRVVGWACIVFFTASTIGAFLSGQYKPAIGLSLFAMLGVYVVLGAGNFDIDENGLVHRSFFGTWKILWNEISSVEVGEVDGTLVLHGDNKRFILSPPGGWAGVNKSEALSFVIKQFEARHLTPQPSRTAAYKIMKNTRVL